MPLLQACKTNYNLEKYSSELLESIKQCLERIPRAAPFFYSKRWRTLLLTELRKKPSQWLNEWTTSKRRGEAYLPYLANVRQSKKIYFREMKLQKKRHWKNFSKDLNNIWKANSYTKQTQGFILIPTLQHDQKTYDSDEDKAELLILTFPPHQPATITPETALPSSTQLRWSLLTRKEVKSAFFSQKPDKALGLDTIPFRVWHQL